MNFWWPLFVLTSVGSAEPRLRKVDFSLEDSRAHALTVTGAPNLATTLRFSDTFAETAVSCGGGCVSASALKEGDPARAQANWIVDIRPQERTIHLWPGALPSATNPVSAFTSNLFVGLDGGEMINAHLRLLDPLQTRMSADAVVDVEVAKGRSMHARRPKRSLRPGAQPGAEQEAGLQGEEDSLGPFLAGTTRCRAVRWAQPYRHMRMVVRLDQLCAISGTGLRWARITVENRSNAPLHLAGVRLQAELPEGWAGESGHAVDVDTDALAEPIAPGERRGRTLAAIAEPSTNKNTRWMIGVESQVPRSERVAIRNIKFP